MNELPSRLLRASLVATLLLMGGYALAYTDGDWSFNYSGSTATITGYSGSSSAVTIPSTVTRTEEYQERDEDGELHTYHRTYHYSVTAVSSGVFKNKTFLTNVTIPSSVTSIGSESFSGCTSLRFVSLPSVATIGYSAFYNCKALESVETGANLTSLGSSAFSGCAGLQTATIDGTGLAIQSSTFSGCTNLESAIFGDGVKKISFGVSYSSSYQYSSVFQNCHKLKTLRFGSGLKTIDHSTFASLNGLYEVSIPAVTSIDQHAFSGCTNLTKITLASGITKIGDETFKNCNRLQFSEGVLSLPAITSIGRSAFWNCCALETIETGSGLTSLGSYAFSGCTGLTDVKLSATLTTIPSSCFSSCTALETVMIPKSVTKIESSAFRYDSSLTNVWFEGAPPTAGSYAFGGVANGARGHYPRSLADKWLPKIDSNGKWNGLIMHELSQPILRVESASPVNGSITLAWDEGGNGECVSSYAIYRGPGPERLPGYWVEGGITDNSWTDYGYWNAEPVLSPINYWVVAENDHFDIPESNAVETRHRYGLSVCYDRYDDSSTLKAHTQAAADARLFHKLAKTKAYFTKVDLLDNEKATTNGLHNAFKQWSSVVKPGDSFFFFIATHGTIAVDQTTGEEVRSQLVAFDERYPAAALVADTSSFSSDALFVGVIMACHSRSLVDPSDDETKGFEFYLNNGLAQCRPSFVWITSCGTTENSYNVSGLSNTLFGEWFLAQGWEKGYADFPSLSRVGYSGGNGNGTNTMHELVQYARAFAQGVSDYSRSTVYVSKNGDDILDRVVVATNVLPLSIEPPVSAESIEAEKGESDSEIGVSWTSAKTAIMYRVERCLTDPTHESLSDWEWIGTTAETSYDDRIVLPFVDFLYRVRTVNPIGISLSSAPDLGYAGTTDYSNYLHEAATQLNYDDPLSVLPTKQSVCGMPLKDCYIAGLNPKDPNARFEARFDMVDGEPVVTPFPDLGTNRVYTVEGKASLSDTNEVWHAPDGNSRFFRVKVALPE